MKAIKSSAGTWCAPSAKNRSYLAVQNSQLAYDFSWTDRPYLTQMMCHSFRPVMLLVWLSDYIQVTLMLFISEGCVECSSDKLSASKISIEHLPFVHHISR